MREVVLDTETTGLDPAAGHRIVEIGCVELVNHLPTGREYQAYLNPDRDVPDAAFEVHGLSSAFLAQKPRFADVFGEFLAFIGSDRLIIHNAEFDLSFLNAELSRVRAPALPRGHVVDTLELARRKEPGAPASLDALARRFAVDTRARARHGALVDARLLAEVYLRLIGGREPALGLATQAPQEIPETMSTPPGDRAARVPRPHAPTPDERALHAAFIDAVTDPIWRT